MGRIVSNIFTMILLFFRANTNMLYKMSFTMTLRNSYIGNITGTNYLKDQTDVTIQKNVNCTPIVIC